MDVKSFLCQDIDTIKKELTTDFLIKNGREIVKCIFASDNIDTVKYLMEIINSLDYSDKKNIFPSLDIEYDSSNNTYIIELFSIILKNKNIEIVKFCLEEIQDYSNENMIMNHLIHLVSIQENLDIVKCVFGEIKEKIEYKVYVMYDVNGTYLDFDRDPNLVYEDISEHFSKLSLNKNLEIVKYCFEELKTIKDIKEHVFINPYFYKNIFKTVMNSQKSELVNYIFDYFEESLKEMKNEDDSFLFIPICKNDEIKSLFKKRLELLQLI